MSSYLKVDVVAYPFRLSVAAHILYAQMYYIHMRRDWQFRIGTRCVLHRTHTGLQRPIRVVCNS